MIKNTHATENYFFIYNLMATHLNGHDNGRLGFVYENRQLLYRLEISQFSMIIFMFYRMNHKAPVFFNFMYSVEHQQTVLRPYSNVSDLRVWDYFLDEELRHGPSYDYELVVQDQEEEESNAISDSMTSGNGLRENLVGGYDCISRNDLNVCTSQLEDISQLEQELGHLPRSWQHHWQRVEVPPPVPPRETSTALAVLQTTPSTYFKQHGRIMHKKSTMELILKNKMGSGYPGAAAAASGGVEVDPASGTVYAHSHKFEKINYTTYSSCDVCHTLLWGPRSGLKCCDCGFNVHERCRDKAPKTCTRLKTSGLPKDVTSDNFDQYVRDADPGRSRINLEDEDVFYQRNQEDNSQIIHQGYLFKQV